MQKLWLVVLLALAVQAPAKRVHTEKRQAKREQVQPSQLEVDQAKVEAEQAEVENEVVDQPEDADDEAKNRASDDAEDEEDDHYYDNHKGEWELVIPEMQKDIMQVFEVQEHFGFFVNKYKGELDEELDTITQKTIRKKIHARVMDITNYFWTMHAHQEAKFKNEQGMVIGDYTLFNPRYFARRYTWRVAKTSDMDNVLFTIQKRLYSDHCKYLGWFSCRPVLKIYVGKRGDKKQLIYYGVGDKDLEEPEFKFYHHIDEYKMTKHNWVAKVDHKKTKKKFGKAIENDKYKLKVKAGEDAALLLLATACLDVVGDDTRAANRKNDAMADLAEDGAEDYFD